MEVVGSRHLLGVHLFTQLFITVTFVYAISLRVLGHDVRMISFPVAVAVRHLLSESTTYTQRNYECIRQLSATDADLSYSKWRGIRHLKNMIQVKVLITAVASDSRCMQRARRLFHHGSVGGLTRSSAWFLGVRALSSVHRFDIVGRKEGNLACWNLLRSQTSSKSWIEGQWTRPRSLRDRGVTSPIFGPGRHYQDCSPIIRGIESNQVVFTSWNFISPKCIFYCNVDKEASASVELCPRIPLPGLCPWIPLGDFWPHTPIMSPQPWSQIDAYASEAKNEKWK